MGTGCDARSWGAKRASTGSEMSVAPKSAGAAAEQSTESAGWTSKCAIDIKRIMHGICRVLPVLRDRVREMPARLFGMSEATGTLQGLAPPPRYLVCVVDSRAAAVGGGGCCGQDSNFNKHRNCGRIEVEPYAVVCVVAFVTDC